MSHSFLYQLSAGVLVLAVCLSIWYAFDHLDDDDNDGWFA